jgi:hypothetical protein
MKTTRKYPLRNSTVKLVGAGADEGKGGDPWVAPDFVSQV